MSTIPSDVTQSESSASDHDFESMSLGKQLAGTLAVLLVVALAIALRSL